MRQCEANLPIRSGRDARQILRAEPVAAAVRARHGASCRGFRRLEDQLCALTADFDARSAGYSPDRADDLVWAIGRSHQTSTARTAPAWSISIDDAARKSKGVFGIATVPVPLTTLVSAPALQERAGRPRHPSPPRRKILAPNRMQRHAEFAVKSSALVWRMTTLVLSSLGKGHWARRRRGALRSRKFR